MRFSPSRDREASALAYERATDNPDPYALGYWQAVHQLRHAEAARWLDVLHDEMKRGATL